MAKPKKENKVIQQVEQEFEAIQNNNELSDVEKEQQSFLITLEDGLHKQICERVIKKVSPTNFINSIKFASAYHIAREFANKPSNNSWFADFESMFKTLVELLDEKLLSEELLVKIG